jgi:succinoglycan biosynthesis protein ExoA
VTLIDGERRGAAAAMNLGIRHARYPLIAQIDQDVVISPDWLRTLLALLTDRDVAAAQGHYVAAPDAGPWARVMGLDLKQRYHQLGPWTNHVCTGNSIYRRQALLEVGLFDETLGYGYDNDLSYRLTHAGHRLAFRGDALSTHYWREGLLNYARQQYGFGYGRLDLVAKHRRRLAGDDVSRLTMMLHGPLMGLALVLVGTAVVMGLTGASPRVPALGAIAILGVLLAERAYAGSRAAATFNDTAGYWFAPIHLVRDIAWAAAIGIWTVRRIRGISPRPTDSMPPARPARELSIKRTR